MKPSLLEIQHVHAFAGDKQILWDVSCAFESGKISVLMGPNGSGKSTLAHAMMGDPNYQNQKSKIKNQKEKLKIKENKENAPRITLNGIDMTDFPPEKRARMGLFLTFQSPTSIPGVSVIELLRESWRVRYGTKTFNYNEFRTCVSTCAHLLHFEETLLHRSIHEGFSGGERKKIELLQVLVLKPTFVIFDEIDTGVDIDALQRIAEGIKQLKQQGTGIILITHNDRLLRLVDVGSVLIMKNGKIVKKGGREIISEIQSQGYGHL